MNNSKQAGFVPVAAALAGNFFITILKFFGFLFSGSGAMFSEAIHSLADTSNQTLLMIGIKRSSRAANEEFAYGYGRERFFWALISACGVFFVGAGVTIYKGVTSLLVKEEIHVSSFIFVILAVSLIIELLTFFLAIKELKNKNKGTTFKEALKNGDPTTIAVIYEDGVAVIGVLIAFVSILLTLVTGQYYWDALGSVVIGFLLAFIAVILINKNYKFLMERSIPEEYKERVIEILEAEPSIERIIDFKSSTLDINKYRIKCEVEFNGPALMKEVFKNNYIKEEYELIKDDYSEFVRFCADYIDLVPRLMGSKIDKIEKEIKGEIPEIIHIDIEIN